MRCIRAFEHTTVGSLFEEDRGNGLALGLSGFETGVAVMPLVRGEPDDDPHRPEGRIRNTRKMLATAAAIMSVMWYGGPGRADGRPPDASQKVLAESGGRRPEGAEMLRASSQVGSHR